MDFSMKKLRSLRKYIIAALVAAIVTVSANHSLPLGRPRGSYVGRYLGSEIVYTFTGRKVEANVDGMGGSGFYTMEGRAIIVEDTDIGHFDPASNTITISDSTVNIVLKHK